MCVCVSCICDFVCPSVRLSLSLSLSVSPYNWGVVVFVTRLGGGTCAVARTDNGQCLVSSSYNAEASIICSAAFPTQPMDIVSYAVLGYHAAPLPNPP